MPFATNKPEQVDINNDGSVSLEAENGEIREDLRMPDGLANQIGEALDKSDGRLREYRSPRGVALFVANVDDRRHCRFYWR